MIGVTDFSARLGGVEVLHAVTLRAAAGEFLAICGPNGAGKTTLLRGLAGLLPGGRPEPRRVAYVAQGANCAWGLTAAELVGLGRIPHGDRDARAIDAALAACGVAAFRDRRIDHLSGGEARRVMLARALATEPDVLLLDEPVADLDPAAAHAVMALLAARAAAGLCVVAVLHAVDLALRHATRLVVVRAGRIVADAAPEAALPEVAAAFGLPYGVSTAPGLLPPRGV